ncbi:MAG: hypothetical protein KGD68_11705 [Candidatus Lokiarchaeota archaeon]|nr:hypothetical protein [Candidatus Lokiarchaeota archaeon]
MSLYSVLESILVMAAVIFTILGNITVNILYILIGTIMGIIAFLVSLRISLKVKEDTGIDDIIFINAVVYPLMVAIIFTIGSIDVGLPNYQVIWFDLGLSIAVFIIFMCIWIFLKQKWNLLIVEDVQFTIATDKEKYPRFLLATLILGSIFGFLFIIFKLFFIWWGYQITSYVIMCFTLVATILLSFFLSTIVRKMKERPPRVKKVKTPKVKKEKLPKPKKEKIPKVKKEKPPKEKTEPQVNSKNNSS